MLDHHSIEWDATRRFAVFRSKKTRADSLEQYRGTASDFHPQGLIKQFEKRGMPVPKLLRDEAESTLDQGKALRAAHSVRVVANAATAAASTIGGSAGVLASMLGVTLDK